MRDKPPSLRERFLTTAGLVVALVLFGTLGYSFVRHIDLSMAYSHHLAMDTHDRLIDIGNVNDLDPVKIANFKVHGPLPKLSSNAYHQIASFLVTIAIAIDL